MLQLPRVIVRDLKEPKHKELALKLKLLETKVERHDQEIHATFEAIRQLMVSPPEKPKRLIGFGT